MAEINENDLISQGALEAPRELQAGFEGATQALLKLIATGKELGVSIKSSDSIKTVREETEKLTLSQVELQKIEKQIATVQAKNNEEYIKATKALNEAKAAQKEKIALGEKDARLINAQNSSLKQLEAALNKNRTAYANLSSAEERASKSGQELLKIIEQQDREVKDLNASIGNFRPDVGNYAKAGQALQTIAPAATSAAQGIIAMTRAGLAFIATPIGAIIAAIGAALYALTAYFRGSEEGQNRLNKIMAVGSAIFEQFMNVVEAVGEAVYNAFSNPKQAVIDLANLIKENIINRFEGLIELIPQLGKAISLLFKGEFAEAGKVAFNAVTKVSTGIEDATGKIAGLIDETKKLVDAGIDYGTKIANLEAEIDRKERQLIVDRAKTNLEVAKLREQAITLEGDAKRKAIQEAISLETQLSNDEVRFAKLRLRLAELKRDANGDDKAALKEVAEAQAAVTDAEKLRYDNTVKFRKQLESLDDEDAKKKEQQFKAIEKNAINAGNRISKAFKSPLEAKAPTTFLDSIQAGITKVTDTAGFKLDEWKKKTLNLLNDIQEVVNTYAGSLISLFDSISERRIQGIEKEKNALEQKHERDLQLAGDNAAAKAQIDKAYEAQKAKLDRKIVQEKQKQARLDKAISIFNIGIETAKNVVEAFPNPYLIAAAIALGAIQTAAVIAKPIPQFFKGTKSAPGGAAVVGEQGVELMKKPGQDWELTPSVATVMDVPRGTEIVPHGETMRRLAMGALAQNGGSAQSTEQRHNEQLLQEMKSVNRNLSNIKPTKHNLIRNGATLYMAIEDKKGHTKLMRGINLGKWF